MSTRNKLHNATQLFESGMSLFREERYPEALEKFITAQGSFRRYDAPGNAFGMPLSNGVSGLANSLYMEGQCRQRVGDFQRAAVAYESSFINEKFERSRPFKAFLAPLKQNLVTCYEYLTRDILHTSDAGRSIPLPSIDDVSFKFPCSLPPSLIPLARLYELAPDRYGHLKEFYDHARASDLHERRLKRIPDESAMIKISMYVWSIIIILWTTYGIVVFRALATK